MEDKASRRYACGILLKKPIELRPKTRNADDINKNSVRSRIASSAVFRFTVPSLYPKPPPVPAGCLRRRNRETLTREKSFPKSGSVILPADAAFIKLKQLGHGYELIPALPERIGDDTKCLIGIFIKIMHEYYIAVLYR